MGFVYHGHYLVYFEQGRTEFMRSLGATYRQVEDSGTLLVVVETGLKFRQPARYDDELLIHTKLALHRGVRLRFEYEIRREDAAEAPIHDLGTAEPETGRKVPPSPDVQGTTACA